MYDPLQSKFELSISSELSDGQVLELHLAITKEQLRELGMSSPLDYGMMKFKELCNDRTIYTFRADIQ